MQEEVFRLPSATPSAAKAACFIGLAALKLRLFKN
jgi:hypothetical protein